MVPVRDEAENVRPLVVELYAALGKALDFELIFVDDGSRDRTVEELRTLSREFPRLHVLRLRQAYGQSAAIFTGARKARGEWIATLDGDGQNDPGDIQVLLKARDAQVPQPVMVVGWRRRREDPWLKRAASRVANTACRWFLNDPSPDVGCGLKLFRRDAFLALPYFDHMHRFLPALVLACGGTVISVEVRHRPRRGGRSKYGIRDRLWVGIVDLFGVRWLQKRIKYPVIEAEEEGGPPA